jgi:predicted DNA-binding protein with PD1-like motif
MEFSRIGDDVLLRLDPGEEIHQSIQSLSKHGIDCAVITSGIGRVRDIRMGYLDSDGIYQTLVHEGPMELLSTQGNLAPGPDGPFTHLHTLMSDNGHSVHGGHLYHATIHVVGEIHLRVLDSNAMKREPTDTDFVALKFCDLG